MSKKQMLPIFAVMFLMTLLMVSSVSAYITDQHYKIDSESFELAPNSPIAQEIRGYEDYFHACNELTDITVASYFDIDTDANDKWYDKLIKAVSFKMGKPYKATHDPVACINNLPEARTIQEKACGYGVCAHQVQDSVPHNKIIPDVIRKTGIPNGLIHSVEEIYLKDKFTDKADYVGSRNVLDLGYEMTPYLERVFGDDPALQNVDIPLLIDLFITQVKPDKDYTLGFKSFFAIPTYVYWFIFLGFLIAIALLGLTTRKLINKEFNTVTLFSFSMASIILVFFGTVIYGLLNKNIWEIYMGLSQFLFSSAMYPIGGLFIILGGFIVFRFIFAKEKVANLGSLFVAVFLVILGLWVMTFPSALDLGHTQMIAYHNEAVQNTVNLLNKGVVQAQTVPDPTGYLALKEADAENAVTRNLIMGSMVVLLIGILFFTFKPRKNKKEKILI